MQVTVDYKNILVPVDFTDPSRKAFYVALKYASIFNAKLWVLHITEEPDSEKEVKKTTEELIRLEEGVKRRINELLEKGGISEVDKSKVFVEFRGGNIADEILKFTWEHNCDLIVIGYNPFKKGLKKLLDPSPTEKVVERAGCDVLVIKPNEYVYTPDEIPEKYIV